MQVERTPPGWGRSVSRKQYTRRTYQTKSRSETTWKMMGPLQPRTCDICHERLVISGSKGPLWFSHLPVFSRHFDCHLKQRAEQRAA